MGDSAPAIPVTLIYRRLGADLPFTDPRRAHGIGLEGYYWRFTGPSWSLAVICGVCRDARGATWAMVTVCSQPDDVEHTEIAPVARADARGFGVVADGDAAAPPHGIAAPARLRATPAGLEVSLAGVSLHARFTARRDWPARRAFAALGPAQVVPGLGQYWTPHLLSAHVTGEARLGDRVLDLTGARVYAEKNWGTAFARHWWWGQASFADDAGVAFAGGRVHGVAPTAVVMWMRGELVALAPPFARTVARAGGGEWHIRARSARHELELRGEATAAPLLLPVPVAHERRLDVRSQHHLAGRLELTARRGNRLLLRAESRIAGLEDGRPVEVRAEPAEYRCMPPPAGSAH